MHVLIVPTERYMTPDEPLGGIFQQHQACALSHAGIRVGVIAPAPRSLRSAKWSLGELSRGIDFQTDAGIPVYRFEGLNWPTAKTDWLHQWYWNYIGGKLFARYVRERGRPDLIHAHNWLGAGIFATKVASQHTIPVIVTEHSSLYARGSLSHWQTRAVQHALQKASARLVVSPSLGGTLTKRFGNTFQPWQYLPNTLDNLFETLEILPKSLKPKAIFRFLNVGMMVEVKNQELLLGAFARAFGGAPDVVLRIGGDGPLRSKLENLAVELGISTQVTFLGRLEREDLLREMDTCNAFVLSSDYETFGVVLIEAAACGKPLIAPSGSGPESVVHSGNGFLFPPGDLVALAETMKCLMETSHRYDPAAIRCDCIARFGSHAVTRQLIDLYTSVLKTKACNKTQETIASERAFAV